MATIANVPLELLRAIAERLSLRDLCNWVLSCPPLNTKLLGSESFCAELVERLIPYSKEASLAREGHISYRKALVNVFQRREAFARCKPIEVLVVACGTDFIYYEGTLCVLNGNILSITTGSSTKSTIRVDLDLVCRTEEMMPEAVIYKLTHYAANLLTVRIKTSKKCQLAVLDIRDMYQNISGPSMLIDMPESQLHFVRNSDKYLVVGTYRSTRDRGMTWHFTVFSFKRSAYTRLDVIGNFCSTEIGSSIVFEIVDDWFWVLTSQITSDPEGADPTSYYGGCFIDLARGCTKPYYWRLWRRQQIEGPIDDSWTKLSLSKDDLGRYIICETRTEFLHSAEKVRSFYTNIFTLPSSSIQIHSFAQEHLDDEDKEDEIAELHDSWTNSSAPNAQRSPKLGATEKLARAARTDADDYLENMLALAPPHALVTFTGVRVRHCEYEFTGTIPISPAFRSKQTLHHEYNPNAHAFIDLVNDSKLKVASPSVLSASPNFSGKPTAPIQPDILRLRVGSRYTVSKPANDQQHMLNSNCSLVPGSQPMTPTQSSLERDCQSATNFRTEPQYFAHHPLILYPGRAEKGGMSKAFELGSGISPTSIRAFSDERALVFGCRTRIGQQPNKIVLVSFDPMAQWKAIESQEQDGTSIEGLEQPLRLGHLAASAVTTETVAGSLNHTTYPAQITNQESNIEQKREREASILQGDSALETRSVGNCQQNSTGSSNEVGCDSIKGMLQNAGSGKRRRVEEDSGKESVGNANEAVDSGMLDSAEWENTDDDTDAILRMSFGDGDDFDSSDDDLFALGLKPA